MMALLLSLLLQNPPHPGSAAEGQAVAKVEEMLRDPATTPAQMEAAEADFQKHFPKSDFAGLVAEDGMRYFALPAHADLARLEAYGAAALVADPDNLYVLRVLGEAIPRLAQGEGREAQLKLAADYNQRALTIAEAINPTPGQTVLVHGRRLDYDQANQLRSDTIAVAEGNLGRIALQQHNYQGAAEALQAAVVVATPTERGADDYYLALAQEGLGQWAAAEASLTDAQAQDMPDAAQRQAVATELVKVRQKTGHRT